MMLRSDTSPRFFPLWSILFTITPFCSTVSHLSVSLRNVPESIYSHKKKKKKIKKKKIIKKKKKKKNLKKKIIKYEN